jgi:ketosteroid isomerase-like protein
MMAGQPGAVLGPREVFARMKQQWLANSFDAIDSLLADDAVVESPFALPGQPQRIVGREEFVAFARAERPLLPVRFEECRETAVHETADPEVIVVEYELTGTVTTTGHRASAPFIGVLRVRDGKIAAWREYQDKAAIARALTQPVARG